MDYDLERAEMLEFIPASTRRLLEVGCETGRFGAALRAAYPAMEIWGIDPTPSPPNRPQAYQTRIVGSFPADIADGEKFDCVVFNDVLEHLIDPWDALRRTHSFLRPDAVVVVSIPNVRHISVLRPLLIGGRWDYRDCGILDRTHLRFFTRATAIELLRSTGYAVERVQRLQWAGSERGRVAVANRILRGRLDDFLAQQYAIVGRRNV
ncbi:MAG TPA: class I SAM-dependent methyltransferase [Acidimicrobiia bacterium]